MGVAGARANVCDGNFTNRVCFLAASKQLPSVQLRKNESTSQANQAVISIGVAAVGVERRRAARDSAAL